MRAATHKAKKGKKGTTFAKVITDKIATGDPIADREIDRVGPWRDAKPYTTKYQFLSEFPYYDNKLLLVAEFLCDFMTRENITPSTKRVYTSTITWCIFQGSYTTNISGR
jgi:hypothetical protein